MIPVARTPERLRYTYWYDNLCDMRINLQDSLCGIKYYDVESYGVGLY